MRSDFSSNSNSSCCCFLHINRSGLNHTRYPVIYVVANPVRGLLGRKISEELLPSSNESRRKTQTHKNDKEKGTGITNTHARKR